MGLIDDNNNNPLYLTPEMLEFYENLTGIKFGIPLKLDLDGWRRTLGICGDKLPE